jgi:DNA polymerase III alpha subunit (gram-positive type)
MEENLLRFCNDKVFTFIDFETCNLCLSFNNNRPWQVAMLKVKGSSVIDRKNFYVKWSDDIKISSEAAKITRFSQKTMDEKGLSPDNVFPTMRDWLENCDYIIGHNLLCFDIYFIKDWYGLMGFDYRHLVKKVIDTLSLAKGIKFDMPYRPPESLIEYQYRMSSQIRKGIKTNLESLGHFFDISHDYDNLHNAIVDLELNLKVWDKMKWKIEI